MCAWHGSTETNLAGTLHRYAMAFIYMRQAPGSTCLVTEAYMS